MAKAFLLLHLSLLLLSSFTVFGDEENIVSFVAQPPYHHGGYASAPSPHHHHHHRHLAHPPANAPAHPPSHHHHHAHPPTTAPAHPPSHHHHHAHPPSHAPVHPPTPAPAYPPKGPMPRTFVAVQGVVYCKSCKYNGSDTLAGASPVLGATVKLQCNNTKYPQEVQTKTDKNGYFFLQAPKTVTNYGAHKCKVSLVSSPMPSCQKPSLLHAGAIGAILKPEKPFTVNKLPFFLYSVGPFAFEPKCY
ncbi:non-classical arabinogalactan protein 31-like [Pistacia vera]|uniref:non-classical arabinogalactan protein 31-like n=1 Tax=Pistacia vera TaxID=55513 RepID=UPI001263131A|nr:non-classical arabinogalactan protein 31-like [Pistacia vera]